MQDEQSKAADNKEHVDSPDESAAEADILSVHRISKVWFIPIVALLIGSWMIYQA